MHSFDYSFLKNDLLPAQLVNLSANIYALRTMSDLRKEANKAAYADKRSRYPC